MECCKCSKFVLRNLIDKLEEEQAEKYDFGETSINVYRSGLQFAIDLIKGEIEVEQLSDRAEKKGSGTAKKANKKRHYNRVCS